MTLRDISGFKPSRRVKLLKGVHWLFSQIVSLGWFLAFIWFVFYVYRRFTEGSWPELDNFILTLVCINIIVFFIGEGTYNKGQKQETKERGEFHNKNLLERLRPPSFIREDFEYETYEYTIYCRSEDSAFFKETIGPDSIRSDQIPIRTNAISKERHRQIKMLAYEEEIPFHGRYVEILYDDEEIVHREQHVFASSNGQYCSCPEYFSYGNPAVPIRDSGEVDSDKLELAHDFLKLRMKACQAMAESRDGQPIR